MTVADAFAGSIDILDPDFYRDPYPGYSWLRQYSPVHRDEKNDLWVLSRHEEVSYVSMHPDLFCSGQGIRPVQSFHFSLIGLDGEDHSRQRRLINKGFSPRMIREMEPRVRAVVTEVLDRVAHQGHCDFVSDIAVPIPLVVIAELMGLPVDDRERFWHWSDRMMAAEGRSDPGDPVLQDAGVAFSEYISYFTAMVEERRARYQEVKQAKERRRTPPPLGTDLISTLVGAAEEGVLSQSQELSQDEFTMFLVIVLVAGNETTRNAISGAMDAFSRFPDQWRHLVAYPELFATMPDEVCRFVSPVISFMRTATTDTEVGGQAIRQGDRLLMLYQSANRDGDVFENPDELRIDRSPNPQLAFGIGPHVCLGINLARLEIRVTFEEIVRRLPDTHVSPGFTPRYSPHTLVRALESLPVQFTPERVR
ncbi:MAG TPA: cytochrome P450 [Acidimicrobiales bacterium]|nr:cytochrome P450 [Acidimicrobiales bacterium]